jgi:ribosomal protein S19E (S16A)
MANIYDVNASDVVKLAAERLKDKIKKPAYIDFVKSGANKKRLNT